MQLLRNIGCASTADTAAVLVLLLLMLLLLLMPAGCLHYYEIAWHVAIHFVMMHNTRLCPCNSTSACPTSLDDLDKLADLPDPADPEDLMQHGLIPQDLPKCLGPGSDRAAGCT